MEEGGRSGHGSHKFENRDKRDDRQFHPYQRNARGGKGGYDGNRGGRQGGAPSPNPPKKKHEENEERLKLLIVRIGDKSTSPLETNLEALANALEGDLPKFKQSIISYILESAAAHPIKASIYGTLVGLLNSRNFDFGRDIVQRAGNVLQQFLNSHKFEEAKLIIRFIGELVNANVLLPSSYINLFNLLISGISDPSTDPNVINKTDYFVYVAISTLPWVGKELEDKEKDEFTSIINRLDAFIAKRGPNTKSSLPILSIFDTHNEDYLTELWKSTKELMQEEWEIHTVLKPFVHFSSRLTGGNNTRHTLGTITLPTTFPNDSYPIKTMFRIFAQRDSEKDMKGIDRFIIEDYILDILFFFQLSHKDGVKQIQNIPVLNEMPFDYLLFEVIFSQLFKLPSSPFKDVYYGALILDFCKAQPVFGTALGLGMDILYEKIEKMEIEAVDRFSSWFGYHLSNTDYKWPWATWESTLKLKEDNLKQLFIREALEKAMRLSYYERVKKTIPEEFYVMLPEKPAPYFIYEDPDVNIEGKAEANELLNKLKAKETSENILNNFLENPASSFGKFNNDQKLEILFTCVLKIGSKSFSHLLAALERNAPLLKKYITSKESEVLIVRVSRDFWKKSPQHVIILIERLLISKIIESSSVVDWLFSPTERVNITRNYVRDILRIAINKTKSRVETIRDELKVAEDALQKVPSEERNEEIPEMKRVKDRRNTLVSQTQTFKSFISSVLQRLCVIITEHNNGGDMTDSTSLWYTCAISLLKEIGRKYLPSSELPQIVAQLEYTPIDQKVSFVLQQLKQL